MTGLEDDSRIGAVPTTSNTGLRRQPSRLRGNDVDCLNWTQGAFCAICCDETLCTDEKGIHQVEEKRVKVKEILKKRYQV